MVAETNLVRELALRMGDNCLILGQRLSEWCGHAPALEEDIALANTALDLIGQTKMWFELACSEADTKQTPDQLAFLRDAREYKNSLLVEQPNADYAITLMRQFLFDAWHHPQLESLVGSSNKQVAAIAQKSIKEVRYHRERSTDLIIRLGDGSLESNAKMQASLDELWRYTGELYEADPIVDQIDKKLGTDAEGVGTKYVAHINAALEAATLKAPSDSPMRTGGRNGLHSESFGLLLAEMQILQRTYPGVQW